MPTPVRRALRAPVTWLLVYVAVLAPIAFWPSPVDRDAGPLLAWITRMLPVLTYGRIEFLANIALFVPFGVLVALMLRRALLAIPVGMAVSLLVEGLQGLLLAERTPSLLDVVANTTGTAIGVLVVIVVKNAPFSARSAYGRPMP
ncbi:VanZ family protein [Microbacterium telephonicum]|uniref:VanZ like protein n=1 Tax=Microbacterium telephonicum TaxID=1714841 RepID=A0A498BXE2_9MICO|nr:VanZ family protein [Microbacterium telephonicum]RLK47992.1 VanZ like protein [Microbacterium telephonicum]